MTEDDAPDLLSSDPLQPTVRLRPKAEARAIRHGFPWVYADELVTDRRTTGIQIEDEGIELRAASRVRGLATLGRVSVTSYNRTVLITGESGSGKEVIAKGPQITVNLNGTTIVDADIEKASTPKTMDGRDHPGLKNPKGHIGFCGHGDYLEFRNIRIKPLD